MANNKVEIENNLNLIRSLITKHKRHDHIFAGVGMFIIISFLVSFAIRDRIGRSIKRDVRTSVSRGLPSRLKKPPGIFPPA